LHFGIDLTKPNDFGIRRVMPRLGRTARSRGPDRLRCHPSKRVENTLIDNGFLCALHDPEVIEMASRFGDPVDLLEGFVD
jgi:hypothetical protein